LKGNIPAFLLVPDDLPELLSLKPRSSPAQLVSKSWRCTQVLESPSQFKVTGNFGTDLVEKGVSLEHWNDDNINTYLLGLAQSFSIVQITERDERLALKQLVSWSLVDDRGHNNVKRGSYNEEKGRMRSCDVYSFKYRHVQ
jgi:hypothetical protein